MKAMRKMKSANLYEFLKDYHLTINASDYFKDVLNFELDVKMPQRKLVELGRALGRIISMEFTLKLGDQGFNKQLIEQALINMQDEVTSIMTQFKTTKLSDVVDYYQENSAWFALQEQPAI